MKVHFIQPLEFNRSPLCTNPYFDPIINLLEKTYGAKASWYIWLVKGDRSGYAKANVRFYYLICFFRNALSKFFCKKCKILNQISVDHIIGIISRPFCKEWRNADIIITQAGVFADVLPYISKSVRIIDLQHGIIYSTHSGYFQKNGRLVAQYQSYINREFWVYGQGYADCFFKHPDNVKDLKGRVKVIGDVIRAGENRAEQVAKKLIVIASQMTTDFSNETLIALKKIYEEAFMQARAYGTVVFRHHPRFNACIDLGDWKERFSWVVTDDARTWHELFVESICVMTISSTTAFDAAAYGVPTILLDGSTVGWANMMVNEYGYPFAEMTVGQYCKMDGIQQSSVMGKVREWYERFYSPFTEENCLRLLRGK